MTITITTWRDPEGKRGSRGATWFAETSVDGQSFTAKSRNGAPNALARQLVEAKISDRPVEIFNLDAGFVSLRYRSLHAMAKWTYTEGNRELRRVPYQSRPDNFDDTGHGSSKNRAGPSFHYPG